MRVTWRDIMNRTLERILPKVQKPARYTGGEYNAVVKDRAAGGHPVCPLLSRHL